MTYEIKVWASRTYTVEAPDATEAVSAAAEQFVDDMKLGYFNVDIEGYGQ